MKYKPGEQGTFQVKVTDVNGKPVQGSTAVSIYDKSVEYISGGSNIPRLKNSSGNGVVIITPGQKAV